jgi:signal transduction histidine kinase
VRDAGSGMSESVRRRAFEPFFTTKPEGGSGLGLATCRALVEQQGGTIEIESSPGAGTAVVVRLPLVA